MRGLKNVLDLIEEGGSSLAASDADADAAAAVAAVLRSAVASGDLSPEALGGAILAQKAAGALGVGAEELARSVALLRGLSEEGMPRHEVANAMTLAMKLGMQQHPHPHADRGGAKGEAAARKEIVEALR